jgi:hypothetical protein
MSIKKEYATGEEKKMKVAALREKHQPVFEALDIPNAIFYPKLAYRPSDKDEYYMAFFPSEFRKCEDIYTEYVSIKCESEDEARTLWKWRFNPHWEEEYEYIDAAPARYLVPVSELVKVSLPEKKKISHQLSIDDMVTTEDAPITELTIRDLVAILHKTPVSNKPWLNNLIK